MNELILVTVPANVIAPVPEFVTVTLPPEVALKVPAEALTVTVTDPEVSISEKLKPVNAVATSSVTTAVIPVVAIVGASSTAETDRVAVVDEDFVPPTPTPPPSLTAIVNVTSEVELADVVNLTFSLVLI